MHWVIDGGFNETQRELIAAGVRYGAKELEVTTTIRHDGSRRINVPVCDYVHVLSVDEALKLFAGLAEALEVRPMFVNGTVSGFIGSPERMRFELSDERRLVGNGVYEVAAVRNAMSNEAK